MNLTEIGDQIQEQLESLRSIAQASVVDTLGFVTEQTRRIIPQTAIQLANKLPDPGKLVDRGFAATEHFLHAQREYAAKLADALSISA